MALCAWLIFDKAVPNKKLNLNVIILSSILIIIIGILLSRLIFGIFVFPHFYSSDYTFTYFDLIRIVNIFIIFIGGIGGYAIIRYFSEKNEWEKKKDLLEQEKRNAELSFLKAQLHPHFLFNTLNAIYNEALKKSDNTAEMIIRLSDMLRSVLYENDKNNIRLSKELALIENYVSLEKMRFGKRLKYEFINEIEDVSGLYIPAFSLFALVENAFKHGVSDSSDESFVHMKLRAEKAYLLFEIENSLHPDSKDDLGAKKGIGLKNMRKQLDLMFGEAYELKQEKTARQFKSTLKIPLE